MRMIILLISLVVLGGCTSTLTTSPYVAICNVPVCSETAIHIENRHQKAEGMRIIASPALGFTVKNELSKIAQQGNILLLISKNEWKLGATTLSIVDIGLEDAAINIQDFMGWVFLNDFKTLEATKPQDVILHSVRGFKLSSFGVETPAYFIRDHLTVFYYLTEKKHPSSTKNQYQIIVLDDRTPSVATMIDLFNFTEGNFQRFIATLNSHKL